MVDGMAVVDALAPDPGQPRRDKGGDIASFPIERLRGSRRR